MRISRLCVPITLNSTGLVPLPIVNILHEKLLGIMLELNLRTFGGPYNQYLHFTNEETDAQLGRLLAQRDREGTQTNACCYLKQ